MKATVHFFVCIASSKHEAPVVQRLDNAIYQINRYPVHKCWQKNHAIRWIEIYPVDSVIHLLNNPSQCVMRILVSYANPRLCLGFRRVIKEILISIDKFNLKLQVSKYLQGHNYIYNITIWGFWFHCPYLLSTIFQIELTIIWSLGCCTPKDSPPPPFWKSWKCKYRWTTTGTISHVSV